jgi:hypothetical protein
MTCDKLAKVDKCPLSTVHSYVCPCTVIQGRETCSYYMTCAKLAKVDKCPLSTVHSYVCPCPVIQRRETCLYYMTCAKLAKAGKCPLSTVHSYVCPCPVIKRQETCSYYITSAKLAKVDKYPLSTCPQRRYQVFPGLSRKYNNTGIKWKHLTARSKQRFSMPKGPPCGSTRKFSEIFSPENCPNHVKTLRLALLTCPRQFSRSYPKALHRTWRTP